MNTLNAEGVPGAGMPVLRSGFRPFFLGATLFAVVSMSIWTVMLRGRAALTGPLLSPVQWHAHEMIYGYALAVVAGFLLTAVRNWTGLQTARGVPLAVLVSAWAGARLAFVAGSVAAGCLLDLVFMTLLLAAIASPLVRARQWRQAGILAKLVLLTAGNALFYLGSFGLVEQGAHLGLYGGLYLLVSLVLTIGARVVPGFIERGVEPPVRIVTYRWVSPASLLLFLAFFVTDLLLGDVLLAGALAFALFAVNLVRLVTWHTAAIWRRPLLWSLFLAFAFIDLGFLLMGLSAFTEVPRALAVHAFGVGGVGLATLSMMSRVALGHTGHTIHAPPVAVTVALVILLAAALVRVVAPLTGFVSYPGTIGVSQALWIGAFAIAFFRLLPVLCRPRPDGQAG